jgi:GcrA cell cycle regulator
MNVPWNDGRIIRLKKLWADGLSCTQIARELGGFNGSADGGRSAVIGKIHRLKLPPPNGKARIKKRSPLPRALPAEILPAAVKPKLPAWVETQAAMPAPPPPPPRPRTPVTLDGLVEGLCKWPIGDPQLKSFRFCGDHASHGPYCAEHDGRAYDRTRRPLKQPQRSFYRD